MENREYMVMAQMTDATKKSEDKLLNAALGLCGESGEFADHIKKHKFQGHDLDPEYLEKELGDILWYVVQAASGLNVSLDRLMAQNIEKLSKRYPEGHFEASRSRNRIENIDAVASAFGIPPNILNNVDPDDAQFNNFKKTFTKQEDEEA